MADANPKPQVSHPGLLDLESRLGYRFQNYAHLMLALTHSSFAHESAAHTAGKEGSHATPQKIGPTGLTSTSNERLEFLGDSVLGLVITTCLYQSYPELSEGKLSAMKSRLVSGSVLARIAKVLNLGRCIQLGRGEENLGGRIRKSILACTLEAVIGAVFLDGGWDKAQEITLSLLGDELTNIHRSMKQYDYKSQLQKITQSLYGIVPSYELVSQTGPDHGKVFRVRVRVKGQMFGVARGPSKKMAEQRAARLVLRKIEKHP